jgi:dihydroorotase-like cyclic amidohydrolase
VATGEPRVLETSELRYRHPHSPYAGRTLRAQVQRTILRGQTIYARGRPGGAPIGRLLTPDQNLGWGA